MGTEEDIQAALAVSEEGSFAGVRDRRIHWQSWSPAGDQRIRATVVILHGYGEHLGRYEAVAQALVRARFEVFALDHHGHGRSDGPRARIVLAEAVSDADRLVDIAVQRGGEGPVFVLGHSLGGAISLRYALAHQDRLRGLVLSGALVANDAGRVMTKLGKAIGRVAPWMPVSKLDPKAVSRDPAVVCAYTSDPLVAHGPVPALTAREILVHVETIPDMLAEITVPTLVIYGTEDRLCPPRGSVMLANQLGSSDLSTRAYEGLYHEVLNEPERAQVLGDVIGWLEARSPVL